MSRRTYPKCSECGHSVNQHNELGYCQARPAGLNGNFCICGSTPRDVRSNGGNESGDDGRCGDPWTGIGCPVPGCTHDPQDFGAESGDDG